MKSEFDELWESLTEGDRKDIKELVIERIKRMPDTIRISIG